MDSNYLFFYNPSSLFALRTPSDPVNKRMLDWARGISAFVCILRCERAMVPIVGLPSGQIVVFSLRLCCAIYVRHKGILPTIMITLLFDTFACPLYLSSLSRATRDQCIIKSDAWRGKNCVPREEKNSLRHVILAQSAPEIPLFSLSWCSAGCTSKRCSFHRRRIQERHARGFWELRISCTAVSLKWWRWDFFALNCIHWEYIWNAVCLLFSSMSHRYQQKHLCRSCCVFGFKFEKMQPTPPEYGLRKKNPETPQKRFFQSNNYP